MPCSARSRRSAVTASTCRGSRARHAAAFHSVGEATDAYITNLNTHPAYAGFRTARAAMRERGEDLEGYRLIGTLLRYSERGQEYVQFVRQIMRENELQRLRQGASCLGSAASGPTGGLTSSAAADRHR